MDGFVSFTDSDGIVWQIEAQRWKEAARMAAVITHRYPSARQHVVAMLSEIGGRGWQDSIRLIIKEQDVTAELRPLYDHLATPNMKLSDESVRAIGERMNAIGGLDAMIGASQLLKDLAGKKANALNLAWDGIGKWQA